MIKSVKRYDYGELSNVKRSSQGFLRIPGFITRTGVFSYRDGEGNVRRELRHPEDVFLPDSLETLKQTPVTLEHPPEMVTPTNVSKYMKGYVGERLDVVQDKIEGDLTISHQDAIDAVEKKGIKELSAGYLADLEPEVGHFNGAPYNFRQKNIRYNHVALVDRGRAGPEVRLRLDSADAVMENEPVALATTQGEQTMMPEKLMIGGQEVELPGEAASVIKDMMGRYDEMKAKLDEFMSSQPAEKEFPAPEGAMGTGYEKQVTGDTDVDQSGIPSKITEEQQAPDGRDAGKKIGASDTSGASAARGDEDPPTMVAGSEDFKEQLDSAIARADALQAKLDQYQADACPSERKDSDDFRVRVRKRVKLEKAAEVILGGEANSRFDSMSDDDLRAECIKKRHPGVDLADKSSIYLEARFDSIAEKVGKATKFNRSLGRGMLHNDTQEADPQGARQKAMAESRDAWKRPLTAVK